MNGFKRTMLSLLSLLTIGMGAVGVAACGGVEINPNGNGGIVVTPNDGNTSTSSQSQSEAVESSSVIDVESEQSEAVESSVEESTESTESSVSEESSDLESSSEESSDDSSADHQHVWMEGVITQQPTCTANGEKTYWCETCDETKTEDVPMVTHALTTYAAQAATCTEKGWLAYVTCETCDYNTYTEIPATGHMYGAGVVVQQPTCTEKGVLKYTCYYCTDVHTEEIEETGHSYGVWSVATPATCEENGVEQRVCAFDSSHVETHSISKTGHNYGEWVQTVAPTCAVLGEEQRTCANDSGHVETRSVPKTDDHDVGGDGVCTVCYKTVKNRLATPVVQDAGDNESVAWNVVENAEYYLVHVLPNDEYVDVTNPEISLENYFAGNKTLRISVQAVVEENDNYVSSVWSDLYIYEIIGETVVGTRGVGDAVNLLTGGYTEYASGTIRIFDETQFNRLRLEEDTSVKSSFTTVTYEEGLESYLNEKTSTITNKTKLNASAGIPKVIKATSGYELEVGEKYQRSTYGTTKAVFYDMDYYYISSQKEIYGYTDMSKLSSILSAEFLADARKLENGTMSAISFIEKYGTHIVTAGIYGASFNAHYEIVTDTETAKTMFGQNIKNTISKGISGSIKGIDLGIDVSNSTEISKESLVSHTTESVYSRFMISSKGGSAQGFSGTSLADVASASEQWATGLNDGNYVLVDVPDNSLYFVWDFLGDEYTVAKDILNEYFFAKCDESYFALKDKISSLYSESATFDAERGILTVNFAGLQTYEKADLSGVSYNKEEHGIDLANGELIVYSMVNGVPVQKVIFKGSYYKTDASGQIKQNYFDGLTIKFDQYWNDDIEVEFDSFAYKAPAGKAALDFSEVSSENITLNIIGRTWLQGGNGAVGIMASGKNISIIGGDEFKVDGGNGISATVAGGDGTDGAAGIIVDSLTIDMPGTFIINGGDGGNGSEGKTGSATSSGGKGGVGGNGGMAINCQTMSMINSNTKVCIIGGNGGNGGKGGYITNGSNNNGMYNMADAGNGGNGGNGGVPILIASLKNLTCLSLELKYGNGGNGGNGGKGGNPTVLSNDYDPDHKSAGGHGGNGGNGYVAGNGGNGGNGGGSYGTDRWTTSSGELWGTSGDGGNGGNGGNIIFGVLYTFEGPQLLQTSEDCGNGGKLGTAGPILDKGESEHGKSGSNGKSGVAGTTDSSYYMSFETQFS